MFYLPWLRLHMHTLYKLCIVNVCVHPHKYIYWLHVCCYCMIYNSCECCRRNAFQFQVYIYRHCHRYKICRDVLGTEYVCIACVNIKLFSSMYSKSSGECVCSHKIRAFTQRHSHSHTHTFIQLHLMQCNAYTPSKWRAIHTELCRIFWCRFGRSFAHSLVRSFGCFVSRSLARSLLRLFTSFHCHWEQKYIWNEQSQLNFSLYYIQNVTHDNIFH